MLGRRSGKNNRANAKSAGIMWYHRWCRSIRDGPRLGGTIVSPSGGLGGILRKYHQQNWPRWRACLRFDTSGKMVPDEMFWSRFADNLRRFETWASIAKIDDLIRLNPPDPDIWSSINLNPMEERPVIASYKWLCDRYLRGDPNTWSTNSLYKEYLFIHDGDTDTFAPMALEPIRVSEMELNAAIAERAVRQASYENESMLYEQIFESAKLFLQENNYRMAAALFKFYLTQNPQNTNALNSMGFCLIPESPAEAESIIRDAISRGYRCACLAAYNLCCCQILQQDLESALRVADNYRIQYLLAHRKIGIRMREH